MENEHGEIITRGVPIVEITSPRTFEFSFFDFIYFIELSLGLEYDHLREKQVKYSIVGGSIWAMT
jgi:hypothetical protein